MLPKYNVNDPIACKIEPVKIFDVGRGYRLGISGRTYRLCRLYHKFAGINGESCRRRFYSCALTFEHALDKLAPAFVEIKL